MKLRSLLIVSFLLLNLLFGSKNVFADHCAGYDLKYEWKGGLDYEVTLYFYRDCSGILAPSSVNICTSSSTCNLSGNTFLYPIDTNIVTPVCTTVQTICTNGSYPGIEQHVYQGIITLPKKCTDWLFSWGTCCRNFAITNVVSPAGQSIYAEAFLNNVDAPDNSSVYFTNLPVTWLCYNQSFTYNHGATDPDGDSLVYSLATPMTGSSCTYTGTISYNGPFTYLQPLTTAGGMTLNTVTGDINLQATVSTEVSQMLVRVEEFRKGILIGRVYRDMQLYVITCNNTLPVLSGIDSTNVYIIDACVNQPLSFDIFSFDADFGQSLTMVWNGGIPGGNFSSTGLPHPIGSFSWTPTLNDLGFNSFTVLVEDNNCPWTGLQIFSYTIFVKTLDVDLGPDFHLACNGTSTLTPVVSGGVGGYTYLWSTGQTSASIIALDPAQYVVEVTDSTGCWGTDTIQLLKNISTNFGYLNACVGVSAAFFDSSIANAGSVVAWDWDFGDGNSSTLQNPTHVYVAGGTFSVILISTDNLGCKDTMLIAVTIYPLPTPDFTIDLSCLGGITKFNDLSTPAGTIVTWNWNFSNSQTSTLKNPSTSYNTVGTYSAILTVMDSNGCSNTISYPVIVNARPIADFLTPDLCYGETNNFSDNSSAPAGGVVTWIWDFGDGATSSFSDPSHVYPDSGTYNVTFIISDSLGCWDTIVKPVVIHATPDVVFDAVLYEGCRTLVVDFLNQSNPIIGSTFEWKFGDFTSSTQEIPKNFYYTPGVFTVELTTTTQYGCDSTYVVPDMITVYELPEAEFTYDPGRPSIFRNTIQFLDESLYAENWYWDFGTGMNDYSTLQFPVFTYEDTLTYTVGLIVKKFWHSNTTLGCYDTISHDIFIEPEMSYHLPNAFSPNGDGLNDKFIGVGYFVTITDFSMQVWTRWGELVYESSDIEEGWNGRLFNNGDQVNDGVYVYVVAIKDKTFATHKFKGFVILVD